MSHPKRERTILIIKPDAVKRGLAGEIISRIERRGLKIIALRMFLATKDQIDNHYPKDEQWIRRIGEKTLKNYQEYNIDAKEELGTEDPLEIGKIVRTWLIDFLTSGPMVKMVIEGIHAINMVRKIVGPTMPAQADMGTIRGDFSVDDSTAANKDKRSVRNLVHASETPEESKHEIEFWLAPDEIFDYKRAEDDVM
ncbi:nucleoside-diphosphate kinase [Patescibacteria group bacterium]|nr:nucleoside-diphosphate kinase [Patescibacteria group bacterium]